MMRQDFCWCSDHHIPIVDDSCQVDLQNAYYTVESFVLGKLYILVINRGYLRAFGARSAMTSYHSLSLMSLFLNLVATGKRFQRLMWKGPFPFLYFFGWFRVSTGQQNDLQSARTSRPSGGAVFVNLQFRCAANISSYIFKHEVKDIGNPRGQHLLNYISSMATLQNPPTWKR